MKYFGLIWKNAWRKKLRTSLTILSVLVAFLLFALLSALGYAFKSGADAADAERLIVIDKVSIINFLPISYMARIEAVEGVQSVTHQTWFGGFYQDERQQFPQYPTDARSFMAMYPELEMAEDEYQAWLDNRTGAVVGEDIAEQFGWKVGDRVPIQSTIWTKKDGSQTWEFEIEGIIRNDDPRTNTAYMLFHYDYFDEARAFANGTVGWFILRVAPGADPVQIQKAIDTQFANSPSQTKTSTEAAFVQSFTKQFGNITLIVTLILGAVFFTLLLVAGNTMSQSVRERIAEIAVLKTLGFGDLSVLGIVLSESVLVMLSGGLLGMGIGAALVYVVAPALGAFLPGVYLSPQSALTGFAIMVAAGVAAGIFPALTAMRLSIVDALARG